MVCPEHQFSAAEHLPVPLVRQAHADDLPFRVSSIGFRFALARIGQFINPMFRSIWSFVCPIYATANLSSILPGHAEAAATVGDPTLVGHVVP